jgi:tetratricopeptide (TPR) repeat protein
MASNKSLVNFIFACIVAVLGLTAAGAIYKNLNSPAGRPAAIPETAASQMPADHPSPEIIEKLMALQQQIAGDPQNPDYLAQMANLYYDMQKYDKAIEYYQQSLNIRPGDASVETDLAASFHYLGQSDKALETLDKILEYQPGFPQAMFNKGVILAHAKNDVQGAIKVWDDLLQTNPDFSQKANLQQMIRQLKTADR